ncbi:MAG TPA: hypothetical protein VLZ06_11425 [Solirubrobacteraceae bacterium]|nr:hypothetical protein [Solirubrobacteraceae bacterium]
MAHVSAWRREAGDIRLQHQEGALVIGYDEDPGNHTQTGSHDLIVGQEQQFTSCGNGRRASSTEERIRSHPVDA